MAASTVAQYLAALPADRRAALSAVRKAINENLPDGYEEGMQFGMIGWYVPLAMYPAGYGENPKVPLPLVALASQKSGMVLHFLCFYGHPTLSTWFVSAYKKSGKKLDMGKGCVRFKKLEDLALDVVGRTVARVSVEQHMANYQAARALMGKGHNAGEGAAHHGESSTGFPVTDCVANGRASQVRPGKTLAFVGARLRRLVPRGVRQVPRGLAT
jgi:hypothetical protein